MPIKQNNMSAYIAKISRGAWNYMFGQNVEFPVKNISDYLFATTGFVVLKGIRAECFLNCFPGHHADCSAYQRSTAPTGFSDFVPVSNH